MNLQYLAALIDGEGCISLHENRSGKKKRYQTPRIIGQLSIGMSALSLIRSLKEEYGGCLHDGGQNRRNSRYKPMLYWTVTASIAEEILSQVLPFLRVKRRQAELLLKLQACKRKYGRRPTRGAITMRRKWVKECQALNG